MVGFFSQKEEKEINNLEDLEKFVSSEVNSLQIFENSLTKELKELDDLKNNFKVIEKQFLSIEILIKQRDGIINKIFLQKHQQPSQINLKLCKELYHMLEHVNPQISNMMTRTREELRRLFLHETHFIYEMSKTNKQSMDDIDKKSREIYAKLHQMELFANSTNDELSKFYNDLKILQYQRENLENSHNRRIGF